MMINLLNSSAMYNREQVGGGGGEVEERGLVRSAVVRGNW
jgi:hypothetical protein